MILREQFYTNKRRIYYHGAKSPQLDKEKSRYPWLFLTTNLYYAIGYAKKRYEDYCGVFAFNLAEKLNIWNGQSKVDFERIKNLDYIGDFDKEALRKGYDLINMGFNRRDFVKDLEDMGYDGFFSFEYTNIHDKQLDLQYNAIGIFDTNKLIKRGFYSYEDLLIKSERFYNKIEEQYNACVRYCSKKGLFGQNGDHSLMVYLSNEFKGLPQSEIEYILKNEKPVPFEDPKKVQESRHNCLIDLNEPNFIYDEKLQGRYKPMRESYYFNEQGSEGFTSIKDKKRLSEAIYMGYKIMMMKEASDRIEDRAGKIRLVENDPKLENKFCMGSWLYDHGKLFIKRVPNGTPPQLWPRHVNIIDEHKEELGVPVTNDNRLEINRIFKRGFNYYDDINNVYTIMAGETFTDENRDEVLAAFNVPNDVEYIVKQTSALDPVEIDPKYLREQTVVLREMATRWHPSDEGGKWPMWIKIGSGVHGDGQSEHGIPHAHFETKNGKEKGVFSLQEEYPPKNPMEISVIEGNISPDWKKILVEWANSPAKIGNKKLNITKWEQSRDDWDVNRD